MVKKQKKAGLIVANIRPIREGFEIVKNIKSDIKSSVKTIVDHAVKGNSKFASEFRRISWNTLTAKDVFYMILLIISYGLKTKKGLFEKYVRQEYMRGNASVFNLMLDYSGVKVKECLNNCGFRRLFKSIFEDANQDIDWKKEFNELCMRLSRITRNDREPGDVAEIKALIDSIFMGRNVDPDYDVEDKI